MDLLDAKIGLGYVDRSGFPCINPSVILTKNREATGLLARVLSRGVVLSHPIINPFSVGLNVPEYLWLIVLFDTTP